MKLEFPHIQRIKTGERLLMSFAVPKHREAEYAALVVKGQPLDRYDLIIETPRKKRSTGYLSQNHRLNGHCAQIANTIGEEFATVKLYVKRLAIKRGLPIKTDAAGKLVYSRLDGEPVPISESDMSVEQCAWVIEEVNILAAELGIVLLE